MKRVASPATSFLVCDGFPEGSGRLWADDIASKGGTWRHCPFRSRFPTSHSPEWLGLCERLPAHFVRTSVHVVRNHGVCTGGASADPRVSALQYLTPVNTTPCVFASSRDLWPWGGEAVSRRDPLCRAASCAWSRGRRDRFQPSCPTSCSY